MGNCCKAELRSTEWGGEDWSDLMMSPKKNNNRVNRKRRPSQKVFDENQVLSIGKVQKEKLFGEFGATICDDDNNNNNNNGSRIKIRISKKELARLLQEHKGQFHQQHRASAEQKSGEMMNQQNQGSSGYPSSVPMKRKRGRPRKEEAVFQGETTSAIMPPSDNVLNPPTQVVSTGITAHDHSDAMVGKMVTGVIEGSFSAGYLLNVKVADSDSQLRGLVFLPGQVTPITAQNDVAPQVRMIQRKEIPIPVLNPQQALTNNDYVPLPPQTLTDDYIPSPAQCSKQVCEDEAELHLPNPQVLPIEMHSSTPPLSLENQSASAMAVAAAVELPKNDIPQAISEPGYENQLSSMVSKFECEKPVRQNETFHQIDTSTEAKESGADGGVTKVQDPDPKPISQPIIFLPTIETTQTGQQTMPSEQKANEPIRDEISKISEIELNKSPVSAEPESMPSEQVSESVVDSFMEKQDSPKTEGLQDMVGKLATAEMLSMIDTSNSNGKPSTGVGNGIDMVGSNHAPDSNQPISMVSEEIKISSEGCAFQDKSGGSFDAIGKVDVNQPTES
ncbi:hypothetical protein PIB30_033538 [Stylosanthes scabra]|uniref:Uncharacterized protein n=1 Tax=Stylosanthes scabra TaxID=79078 RepID=A0ABU6TCR3_9FABA|nr:hypothetical protein [Stylosanthes scabra]